MVHSLTALGIILEKLAQCQVLTVTGLIEVSTHIRKLFVVFYTSSDGADSVDKDLQYSLIIFALSLSMRQRQGSKL
jgi:hypothetical protein